MSKTYTTIQGDMWDTVAYKTLGSAAHTDKLIDANTRHRHYFIFTAGVELVIPGVDVLPAAVNLPPWKRVRG